MNESPRCVVNVVELFNLVLRVAPRAGVPNRKVSLMVKPPSASALETPGHPPHDLFFHARLSPSGEFPSAPQTRRSCEWA
jgi:hypothetical protein